jgi:hypothetical protein
VETSLDEIHAILMLPCTLLMWLDLILSNLMTYGEYFPPTKLLGMKI